MTDERRKAARTSGLQRSTRGDKIGGQEIRTASEFELIGQSRSSRGCPEEIRFLVIAKAGGHYRPTLRAFFLRSVCATDTYVGTFALHNLVAAFRSRIRIRNGYDSRHRKLTFRARSRVSPVFGRALRRGSRKPVAPRRARRDLREIEKLRCILVDCYTVRLKIMNYWYGGGESRGATRYCFRYLDLSVRTVE